MSAIDDFADALRFVGFAASWGDDIIPVSDDEFRKNFVLYKYQGWSFGDPIPEWKPPIKKTEYPALATVLGAMRPRANMGNG